MGSKGGPNGVVVSGHWLFVTDAPSRVVSIDLRTDQIVDTAFTSGDNGNRADELAYDPQDGILLVVNNADFPAVYYFDQSHQPERTPRGAVPAAP